MTERTELAKALTDLNSCILGMLIAHGRNPMADSILDRHAATVEKAQKIALGFDEAPRPEERTNFEEAKAVIAEANNSLYGSQGYFLSTNGGPADKYHLSKPIEELKAACNRWYQAASPYATPEALREALSASSPPRETK